MVQNRRDYQRLASVFRALGHPSRLQILTKTIGAEVCVQDLGDQLDRRQPHVSQHLAVLRDRGLVVPERRGRTVCYRPADSRIAEIIELAAEVFDPPDSS